MNMRDFIIGLLIGGLAVASMSMYSLGRLSTVNDSLRWQALAKACTLNSEQLTAYLKNSLDIDKEDKP